MTKYILHYVDECKYEVEAENEEEALAAPIPDSNHFCSLSVRPKTILDHIEQNRAKTWEEKK